MAYPITPSTSVSARGTPWVNSKVHRRPAHPVGSELSAGEDPTPGHNRPTVATTAHKVVIAKQSVNNGKLDVPAYLYDVVTVTRANIGDTVIKDGMASYDDVYRGVPEAQRPPRPAVP